MADSNKRLAALEKMIAGGQSDPFAHYALGMEYRKVGRVADALATFTSLRGKSPGYLPMYLMAGQMLIADGRREEARSWLEAGIVLAREQGDGKAQGELESALAEAGV